MIPTKITFSNILMLLFYPIFMNPCHSCPKLRAGHQGSQTKKCKCLFKSLQYTLFKNYVNENSQTGSGMFRWLSNLGWKFAEMLI